MLDVRAARESADEPRRIDLDGDERALRHAGGRLARELTEKRTVLDGGTLAGTRLSAFVEGLVLGSYRFSLHEPPGPAARVDLVGVADDEALADGLRRAAATLWARNLTNTPASTKTPAWLAERARIELEGAGVRVTVRDENWLGEQGFGGVLAVGGGSSSPPRFVEASWRPRDARPGVHPIVIGKGITFDSGGINLKPGDSMRTMYTDMAGAAAVFAALRAVAQARLPVRVTVLAPLAENAFSGTAFRPGDVVRHVGGRTSEITNTDAEGRIVLADAMAYAVRRLRPTALVDIATLTGAMKVALGLRTAGLLSTSDDLAAALRHAGEQADEPVWRLPLAAEYRPSLDSAVADAQNAPGNPGGITAGLFLRPFAGSVPWAHLDIAGPARAAADDGVISRGATGFGARLLTHWLESLA